MRLWLPILLLLPILFTGCQSPNGGQRPLFNWSRATSWFSPNRTANSQSNPWALGTGNQNGLFANQDGGGKGFGGLFRSNNQQASNNTLPQNQDFQSLSEQVQTLNQRLGHFDNDNQQLLTDLAGMKQKLQAANDYNYQLKQQLTDSVAQLQQLQNEKLGMEQQLAAAQLQPTSGGMLPAGSTGGVPSQLAGGATLRANNSLLQKISLIQLPGVTTRMDGDVIRVELPTDQLFLPNSYQINNNYGQVLQQLANSISANFPQQIIGIEAHWDNTPIQPATTTHHQLTASQCLSVFDYMSRLGLPDRQMFTMALGSNRPRYPGGVANGVSPNRRVEIVIYPENWNQN